MSEYGTSMNTEVAPLFGLMKVRPVPTQGGSADTSGLQSRRRPASAARRSVRRPGTLQKQSGKQPVVLPETNTILLVEDNEALRAYLQEVLTDAGYTVFVAAHAAQALLMSHAMWAERQGLLDLLITDIAMPDINGVDLADRLRKYCPSLKVLYMSGVMDEASVPFPTTDPHKAFLPKPFLPPVLFQKIEHLLQARSA